MTTLNPRRYDRTGAIKAHDVCVLHAPKVVADSAKKLVKAIDARETAQLAHADARADLDRWHGDDVYASKHSRDELERTYKGTAAKFDETSKAAAALSREHAAIVGEHAEEWSSTISVELGELTARLGSQSAEMVELLDSVDVLRSALTVATETTPGVLHRHKLKPHTRLARDGVALVQEWIDPSPERRSFAGPVVARNLGPLSRESAEFMGRSE